VQSNTTYRDKDGAIQVIVSFKDRYGKWRQRSAQGFQRKKDAKKAAEKIVAELKESQELQLSEEYEGITFAEFKEMYLEHLAIYKEHNTVEAYKSAFKKFSDLDNKELSKITSVQLQSCIDAMVKSGLSAHTVREYTAKTKKLFSTAVEPYKIIAHNPAVGAVVPENKQNNEIKALAKAELDRLISTLTHPDKKVSTLLASKCGLRLGEILGLTWDDIDIINRNVKVNKQWKKRKDGSWGFGPVKRINSNRSVPMPEVVIKELRTYKKITPTSIDGRIITHGNTKVYGNLLIKYYKARGFDISAHDLRHTYATMLIAGGVDFRTAAQLLGHTVEMTMKRYSHVTDDMTTRAGKLIDSIF